MHLPRSAFRRALAIALLAAPALAGLAPSTLAQTAKPSPPQNVSAQPVPTELTSEKLEMTSTEAETTAIATGNVILTGTNLRITCDQLTIIATRIGDSESAIPTVEKFKYILATGNVHITQVDREATCQRAEVFPREDKVVLSQGPVLIDHESGMVATGEPIILLRGQKAVLGTNVKITAPPIGDLSATAAPRTVPTTPTRPAAPAAPGVTFPRPGTK